MYSLRRTVEPASEPVTLDQVKSHCRLGPDYAEDDALLTIYIRAAREYVENETGRALIEQTWVLTRDAFPGGWVNTSPFAAFADVVLRPQILLPKGQVLSVVSVRYYDAANSLQTLDSAVFVADISSQPGRLQPAPGKWWPNTAARSGAVQVTYTAGYGSTAATVPATLCMAVLLMVGHFYENREATQAALTGNGPMPLPLGVEALLSPHTDLSLSYEA